MSEFLHFWETCYICSVQIQYGYFDTDAVPIDSAGSSVNALDSAHRSKNVYVLFKSHRILSFAFEISWRN